jgi:hypothetical protein
MIEIQKTDKTWVKFYCPEWNNYSPEQQKEILRKFRNELENIIRFPNRRADD